MKTDLYLYTQSAEEIPARARQVEDGGFDGLFVAETIGDPYQSLAVAAQHTERVTLGTSVSLAFPRSPMTTAVAAWDLQRASHGRFVLGLGTQVRKHIERRFSMPFSRPTARLRDYVNAVRHIWGAFQGEYALNFQGEFHTHDYLPSAMNPGPLPWGPPPIYLAALGPLMFRAAGAVADGVFIHPIHTHEYLRTVAEPALAEGLAETGRDRAEVTLSATVFAIPGAQHREAVRKQFAFYASTPAYKPVLDLHGWGELGDELRARVRRGELEIMAGSVPDDVLDFFCIVADDWPHAYELARERYTGVVDRINFQTAPPVDVHVHPTAGAVG
ncbi:TIGR03617 family F420-dependent LLM class oxidoreductase [Pseudonocardia kujensis]|uniref:TIGR03617 family F420-dependent LLM class oxidoreductase n=1 Tax=Pseudonocardia kujensis TaxID=1128675 RepID=UPI001E3DB5E3|nr:TIGR03617 family F420-dependent LLM class oxidoreductase [Pseudonocardia kujensis]MCE0762448.1 TIGR03617 family F420-dependent LLM class oxidoreductase [Pseudonocardia kujensis]